MYCCLYFHSTLELKKLSGKSCQLMSNETGQDAVSFHSQLLVVMHRTARQCMHLEVAFTSAVFSLNMYKWVFIYTSISLWPFYPSLLQLTLNNQTFHFNVRVFTSKSDFIYDYPGRYFTEGKKKTLEASRNWKWLYCWSTCKKLQTSSQGKCIFKDSCSRLYFGTLNGPVVNLHLTYLGNGRLAVWMILFST